MCLLSDGPLAQSAVTEETAGAPAIKAHIDQHDEEDRAHSGPTVLQREPIIKF